MKRMWGEKQTQTRDLPKRLYFCLWVWGKVPNQVSLGLGCPPRHLTGGRGPKKAPHRPPHTWLPCAFAPAEALLGDSGDIPAQGWDPAGLNSVLHSVTSPCRCGVGAGGGAKAQPRPLPQPPSSKADPDCLEPFTGLWTRLAGEHHPQTHSLQSTPNFKLKRKICVSVFLALNPA